MISGDEERLIVLVCRLLDYFKAFVEMRLIQKAYRGSFAFFFSEDSHPKHESRFVEIHPLFLPPSDTGYYPSHPVQASLPIQRHLAWMCFDLCSPVSFNPEVGKK